MKKAILAIIASVFVLTDVGAVTRIQCRIDTARKVVVIPAVEGGADVAVAVIDRGIGVPDTTVTIASQLLMQSDLRGHVEDAAWYLRAPRREADPAADALMLTQGWTRYDMPAAIRGEINDSLPYPLEIGAQLDGVIRSKWRGKPLAGVVANVLAARIADGASATTDSLGRFHITGLEWPDSTFLVISAMNSKGQLEENIHPEFDSFPAIAILPESQSIAETFASLGEDPADLDNYVARLNSSPQGMQISLKEVVVRATKKREGANAIDYLASVNIRPAEDKNIRSYEDAVANIPGVNIINDKLLYHQTPVAVWVDGRYLGSSEGRERGGGIARTNIDTPLLGDNQKRTLSDIRKYAEEMGKAALSDSKAYDTGLLSHALTLIDLEGMYPFLENESISYIPPHLSMLFRQGAINDGDIQQRTNGGILSITTKNPGKIKAELSPEFRAVMPLGYQKRNQYYMPAYTPEGTIEEQNGATVAWIPVADLSGELVLPIPSGKGASDIAVTIEGISPEGKNVDYRK
ncbi:hypothetical protein [Muribaculum intestinale]|jgi:hypothetical protein|uniref:hypothetical protein n=2 Tax=Muribaculum intestinale TaxID=1796646 RepID=UPI0025AF4C7A|nr:hypothetical protein [Muribaculum intestinale]